MPWWCVSLGVLAGFVLGVLFTIAAVLALTRRD
jgi:hypothetical protein